MYYDRTDEAMARISQIYEDAGAWRLAREARRARAEEKNVGDGVVHRDSGVTSRPWWRLPAFTLRALLR